jgi:hypothetical protein
MLIPSILVSAHPPSAEADSDPSGRASVDTLGTRAGKQKATANPTPDKKAKKVVGKSSGGIKINEPAPKAPSLTPPSGP